MIFEADAATFVAHFTGYLADGFQVGAPPELARLTRRSTCGS